MYISLVISFCRESVVDPNKLLVGLNAKHIKLYDFRDSDSKLESTASTKAVNGITVDDLGNHRVASFAEHQVFVWDIRHFEKPFVVLNHSKPIHKVGWCPTRSGLLACLERESQFVTLHDVHHAVMSSEEGEPAVLERRLSPCYYPEILGSTSGIPLSSFAWHPTNENLLTTVTSTGVLWNSVVFERMTLNWSPTSKLSWSNGKKLIQYIDDTDEIYSTLKDISISMRTRASNGYGLQPTLRDNGKFVADDAQLKYLWEWLDECRIMTEKEKYRVPSITSKFPGARMALRIDSTSSNPLKSEVTTTNAFSSLSVRIFKSDERSFVQQLCAWDIDSNQKPTRKAAMSLFHLKLAETIKILNESGHSIVAMAIAGFTNDKSSLWQQLAHTSCNQLDDPYIRAIFAFLTESETNYETILNEEQLGVADRLGFACSFLPDNKLFTFVQDLTSEMIKKGNLEAVLLTGMTHQALPLLQKYLDFSGDVQTLATLAIRTMASEIPSNSQLIIWIERYRELLDSWKMWENRAEFDIMKNTNNPALIPQPEVTISCNFCGKNISPSGLHGPSRAVGTQYLSRFTTTNTKLKLSCCPSCRKPLPRCSICLLNMGTILGSGTEHLPDLKRCTGACAEALSWYTWCQSCRHGGHTVHLQIWFQNQSECPVTGCSCRCITLDKVIDFPSRAMTVSTTT